MKHILAALPVAVVYFLTPATAHAQCNGQFGAGQICGNPTGSQALPRPGATSVFGVVTGPASATDNAIARFDGTTGKLIQNSIPTIADDGSFAIVTATSVIGTTTGRGPLFVVNNAASSGNPAGKNMGCQFWVGNNPTATPGANQSVNCTMYIDNLNRDSIWGLNVITLYGDNGAGWADTSGRAIELEVNNFFVANSTTDPWGSANTRKNGIEIVNGASTIGRTTAGIMTWGVQTNGTGWFDSSIALSRGYNYGVRCVADPGGVVDTTPAFKTACFSDESDSVNVLKVSRTHTNGVDFSAATFSGNAFASPGFSVGGTGLLSVTNTGVSSTLGSLGVGTTAGSVIGLSRFVHIVGTAGNTAGFEIGVTGGNTSAVYLSTDGATFGAIATSINMPLSFQTSSTARLSIIGNATHLAPSGTAPALTACGGGSPAITGSDVAGEVTMGTTATGCVITFNVAYVAAPYCTVSWQATPLASQSYTVSTTAITTVQTSTSSNKINYTCMAQSGG